MYYISAFVLATDSPKETATTAISDAAMKPRPRRGEPIPLKKSYRRKRDGRTNVARARVKAKVSRPVQRLLNRVIIDSSTWRQQQMYHRYQTREKVTPQLPVSEWEMPITTKFDITHGPRALGLNTDLLVEAAVGGLKNVANDIQKETARLLGKRKCGGFERTSLPKKNKTALNKRGNDKKALDRYNYLKAIKEEVAFTRAKIYGKCEKEKL